MNMKKPQFATDSIYHIYNRGVEKRDVFLDKDDYFRFIHDLYEFNDEAYAENFYYKQAKLKSYEIESRKISRKRKILVEIIAYCLMPNHFHLLMRQNCESGIVRFMHKLGIGYTMFFNQKYERVGPLFQGRFKAALIENHRHFLYIPHYIHLNPLDLKVPTWKEKGIKNTRKALEFINSYRWSSYPDFIGERNFPSIISNSLFRELYGTPAEYIKSIREWINDMQIEELDDKIIEHEILRD